jgi:undecaprenyl-diphosphatase
VTLVQILVLAVIQGLTEFLPVSSSAHLILGGHLFGWPDQGLVFDVATHLGTLIAVVFYFRKDLFGMVDAWLHEPRNDQDTESRRLGLYLAAASVPGLLVGFLAHDLVEFYLRDLRIIAWATIGFGLLLWVSDALGKRRYEVRDIGLGQALLIGLAQCLAMIPGTSRSGITMTAARFLGMTTDAAARFSFLLAIPIVAAAGGYGMLKVATGEAPINWLQFMLAVGVAAIAGWACIAVFLKLLKKVGLVPFVLYRLALGLALLWAVT